MIMCNCNSNVYFVRIVQLKRRYICIKKDFLLLNVEDNGVGFSIEKLEIGKRRFGLNNIKQRVKELRGHLSIESYKNRGTFIKIKIPLYNNPF